jgi:hypothetical protein
MDRKLVSGAFFDVPFIQGQDIEEQPLDREGIQVNGGDGRGDQRYAAKVSKRHAAQQKLCAPDPERDDANEQSNEQQDFAWADLPHARILPSMPPEGTARSPVSV